MKNYRKIISWLLVILWMSLIFYMSAQTGEQSSELSMGMVEKVVQVIERVAPNIAEQLDIRHFHHLVRKNAHFFVYLVLGVLVMNALSTGTMERKKTIPLALLICVLYAISDEVHQLFVPGRSGEVRDVIIDSAGSSVGIMTYTLLGKVIKKSPRGSRAFEAEVENEGRSRK